MLTIPSTISQFMGRNGAVKGAILVITDGVTTWYFGTMAMPKFTEGYVYPILSTSFVMHESIDIFSKQWNVSGVRLTLLNTHYKTDSSFEPVCFADEMGGVINTEAQIYLFAGPNVTQISDCMLRYSGVVKNYPTYDSEKIVIDLVDKWAAADIMIPQVKLSTTYPNCPNEHKDKYIPLMYGAFAYTPETHTSAGLARGLPTEIGEKPKFVFADHIVYSLTDLFAPPVGSWPLEYTGESMNTNDGGYATGSGTGTYLWLYMFPNGTDDQGHGFPTDKPTNPTYMHNLSWTTYATIKDNVTDLCGTYTYITGIGWVSFDENQENALMNLLRANNANGFNTAMQLIYKAEAIATPGTGVVEIHYQTGAELSNAMTADGNINTSSFTFTSANLSAKDLRVNLAMEWSVHCSDASGYVGDDILNNADMCKCYGMYLKAAYYFPAGLGSVAPIGKQGQVINEQYGWAAGYGREYGSWITASGRSVGGIVSGDAINAIAFIVESLLRDELGMVTADIDTDSFDAAFGNSGMLNLVERDSLYNVIRKLSEQSTFVFYVDGASQARLIPLNNASPSTDLTVYASDIMPLRRGGPPNITTTKTAVYCNKINYKAAWRGEYGRYDYEAVGTNTTSISAYNVTKLGDYTWPSLTTSGAGTLATHLVTGATAIWALPHNKIELSLIGIKYAHLTIGSHIEIDATTMDPVMLLNGGTWSGHQFMVTAIQQHGLDYTEITGIELYT